MTSVPLTDYPRLPDRRLDMLAIGRDWVARLLVEWPDQDLAALNRQFVCELEELGELAEAWLLEENDPILSQKVRGELADNLVVAWIAAAWLGLDIPPQQHHETTASLAFTKVTEMRQLLILARDHGKFARAFRRYSGQARQTGTLDAVRAALITLIRQIHTVAVVLGIDLDAATVEKLDECYARPLKDGPR